MRALGFAWRSLVRQPARAALAILGVAAAGALLLDMLLLSQGLVVSMRDLLERTGWDVRVTSTDDVPGRAPRIRGTADALATIAALPEVDAAIAIRSAEARIDMPAEAIPGPRSSAVGDEAPDSRRPSGLRDLVVSIQGVSTGGPPPWTVLRGRDASVAGEVVLNEAAAAALAAEPGGELTMRASCGAGSDAMPPARVRVAGVAAFPFAGADEYTIGATLDTLSAACGGSAADQADVILVRSSGDADAAAGAVNAARPDLRAVTNREMLGRLEQTGFTYFRQISAVLTTVTLSFAVLLITVLLTVSVNQRLGEIAALRALGFSRRRVVADVFCESALIVGLGGLLSLPLGLVMAQWLDAILKGMPGIPATLHFFVFEERALATHVLLLVATAVIAALYPMRLVSRLPIAATLRDQVTG